MKLNSIVLLIALYTTTLINAQSSSSELIKTALIEAKESKKNVFIRYSASWCGWCKKMSKQMTNDKCAPLFKNNYILVNLVVNESKDNKHLETPGAFDLLKEHKGQTAGLPFWVILDSNGKLIENSLNSKGENLGCPASKEEVKAFITILKKTSNLSTDDLNIITDTFIIRH
ncbi:thioredoxin family protein [Tenacibaculum sp.]|nr:thioredoxin family protein [Tenacibaculum sp.]